MAWAAQQQGVPATIFVPAIVAPVKLDRIRSYGATLVVTGDRYADALAASRAWSTDHDALVIHAYDQSLTLRGQGSVALELSEQAPELDTVLVPVGGGGLVGATAYAAITSGAYRPAAGERVGVVLSGANTSVW